MNPKIWFEKWMASVFNSLVGCALLMVHRLDGGPREGSTRGALEVRVLLEELSIRQTPSR